MGPTDNPTQNTTTSLPTISLPTTPPSGEPTLEPTVHSLDITVPVGNAAMTQSSGGREWMLVAMAVVLVLLVISTAFCYRQCTKPNVECFDGGLAGKGVNQRKPTADHSEDEDEDEENNEFVDTDEDEEEVLTVDLTPEPVQQL